MKANPLNRDQIQAQSPLVKENARHLLAQEDADAQEPLLSSNDCSSESQECKLPNGCGISSPYKCEDDLSSSAASCMTLPFTSITSLQHQACRAPSFSRKQLTVSSSEPGDLTDDVAPEIINPCQSSLLPISCVSGNCVAKIGECRTCLHRCADASHKCVAAEEDCQAISANSQPDLDSMMCQIDLPIRCISTG